MAWKDSMVFFSDVLISNVPVCFLFVCLAHGTCNKIFLLFPFFLWLKIVFVENGKFMAVANEWFSGNLQNDDFSCYFIAFNQILVDFLQFSDQYLKSSTHNSIKFSQIIQINPRYTNEKCNRTNKHLHLL